MKQFIRYLYEYRDGNRVRNVGFTKVEKQMDKCTIHIYGKGMNLVNDRKLEVYVFYVQDGQCVGVRQGVIESTSPVINYILKFQVDDVGDDQTFEQIAGLILQDSDGRKYAAVWEDAEVAIERMKTREEMSREDTLSEAVQGSPGGLAAGTEDVEIVPHESLIEHVEKLVAEQEVEAAEATVEEVVEEVVEEYIPPRTRTYEKIQRRDISRLPRREWKLANNSFLLHGFYNYHHLLYIEEGDKSWIGVPGIYHEKEWTAARAFGFPKFHRITDADVELSNEEKNPYDDFGYWCRQVDRQ